MASIQQGTELLKSVRAKNQGAGLESFNDQELADILFEQTGDERLKPVQQSSALMRGVNTIGSLAGEAGKSVEGFIADENSPYLQKVAGRAVGNLVSSAPEMGMNMASAALKGIPRALGFGAGAAFSYGRTKAETGSDSAATGSAVGSLLSLAGGIKGANVGRQLVGPGKVRGFLAGTAGSAVGSVPGDALEIGMQPGGFDEFLNDPVNLPAYVAGQTVLGAGLDLATQGAEKRTVKKELTKAQTPELDSLINEVEQKELADLIKIPVAEKTELQVAKERELSKRLGVRQSAQNAALSKQPFDPSNFSTYPETPATLQAQAYLVHKGKKAVMEIPRGSDPNLDIMGLAAFREHTSPTNGNLYLYDETKVTPDIIENAIKTDSLGLLLGYGTAAKPKTHNNTAAVLRNKYGVEKAAVILGDGNETAVMKSLGDMALGTDKVHVEPLDQVIKWRQDNSGLQKLFSLSSEMSDGQDEISFTNTVLRNLDKSFQYGKAGLKGPRFQVDQNAEISSKGLVQAVKDWAPASLWEHYKAAGIETLPKSDNVGKIKAADFTKWIRENTPEVEIKKLVPFQLSKDDSQTAQSQHRLESQGFVIDGFGRVFEPEAYGSGMITDISNERYREYGNNTLADIDNLIRNHPSARQQNSDAATGRYGVDPKPLEQMPGAVDILVRVPRKTETYEQYIKNFGMMDLPENRRAYERRGAMNTEATLFSGPHFGESDKNVLASIRGYEETLPSGEKVFHVFELQSDWGQQKAKQEQAVKQAEDPARYQRTMREVKNHPLLAHYETLALKTAIQHARTIGAKYIAISDAETAMMTEGHDRYAGLDENGATRADGLKVITQEKGMRAAYDERLPAIAAKLTRSRSQRVDFGGHSKVEVDEHLNDPALSREENVKRGAIKGSPAFKGPDGRGKNNITARLYDISNPSPEVQKLFSLYDADAQATFEHTLRLESAKRGDGEVSTEQILTKAIGGQSVDMDALLNFLDRIKGMRGVIREGSFLGGGKLGEFSLKTHDIKISKDYSFQVNEAYRLLNHELSHGAVHDLHRNKPEIYNYMRDLIEEMGQPARFSILQELKTSLKLSEKFDPIYLSGGRSDMVMDPYRKDRQAYEFIAGLAEASAEHHLNSTSQPSWYKYLPEPVIKVLQNLARTFKKYFGEQYPGVGHMLDASLDHRLKSVVNLFEKHVNDQAASNLRALLNLQKTSVFDETNFIDSLPNFKENLHSSVANLRGGDGVLHSWAGDMVKNGYDKAGGFFDRFFYTGLFRTRDKPETGAHFWNLHEHRARIQSQIFDVLSDTGQLADGSLSRQQALERYGKFAAEVANPTSKKGQHWLDVTSRILEENGNRRQKKIDEGKMVERKDLMTVQEMMDTYKITQEEADFVEKFSRIPEVVAKEKLRMQREADNFKVATLFYRANKGQSQDGVLDRVGRLSDIASDIGAKRYEMESYQYFVDSQNKLAEPDMELVGKYQADIERLAQEQALLKTLFEQAIRDEFAGSIPMKPGPDTFISTSAEVMVRMGAQREQYRVMTRDIGYAPMTRRGRFNLRVYENSDLGELHGKEKAFLGFDTRAQVDKYIADNNLTTYEIIDKDTLFERAKLFSPSKLKGIRDKAKKDFDELYQEVMGRAQELDPDQRALLTGFLENNFKDRFRPLEEEYRDVVAVKGDKFKERRYLVPGFDRNDFLPNIFEYLDYNTVAGNKQVTRAHGEYLLEDARLDGNQALKNRMQGEIDYTLTNQTEFNFARKAIFYNYIGFSIRHVMQNAVQIPLNGVSQLISEGNGYVGAWSAFTKAAKLAFQYNMKGTTGDRFIDSLLKQAERDGVSVQQSIENPVHESIELQNALDSINAQSSGARVFGKTLAHAGTRMAKGFERFMQSTSSAAESANRKTTFIASILAQRAKGVTDLRTQYGEASKFTNYVNFIGDKPNRPGFMIEQNGNYMHGPFAVASALQSFTLNHISQLVSFYRKGFKQGSKADRQAFYTGLAHLLMFSGSMGFVGANTAEGLFEYITGLFGHPISLKTAIRSGMVKAMTALAGEDEEQQEEYANAADRMSDFVLMGFPGLVGLDLSGSIGLGSPLVRYQAGQPITAEQLAGPGAGMLGKVVDSVGQITADPMNPQQWWAATRSSAPAFLSQFLRVADMMSSGSVVDRNQQPVGDPLGVIGSAGVLVGFNPAEVSKQRQFNSEIYKASKRESEKYELRVRNIASHLAEGNEEMARRQFDEYVQSVGGLQDRSSMVDSIVDQLEEFEGKVTKPASLKASAGRQKLEAAFPSIKHRAPTKQSSLLKTIEVSSLLGQDDLLYQKLESLPSGLLDAILTDALTQAGLRPEAAGLIQRPSSLERLGPNPDLQSLTGR